MPIYYNNQYDFLIFYSSICSSSVNFSGCSSLEQLWPLLAVGVAKTKTVTAIAVASVGSTIAIIGISLRVSRPLAVAITKAAVAVASIAKSVSQSVATIAVVGIGLRVGLPLDQTPVQAPGSALLLWS